jgi:hypothetical protein
MSSETGNNIASVVGPIALSVPGVTAATIEELKDATTRLFGGAVSVEESFDPEYPSDTYTVMTVETTLPVEEIVKTEREWSRTVFRLAPKWESLRLLILPK